jgi:hypothetical protein
MGCWPTYEFKLQSSWPAPSVETKHSIRTKHAVRCISGMSQNSQGATCEQMLNRASDAGTDCFLMLNSRSCPLLKLMPGRPMTAIQAAATRMHKHPCPGTFECRANSPATTREKQPGQLYHRSIWHLRHKDCIDSMHSNEWLYTYIRCRQLGATNLPSAGYGGHPGHSKERQHRRSCHHNNPDRLQCLSKLQTLKG